MNNTRLSYQFHVHAAFVCHEVQGLQEENGVRHFVAVPPQHMYMYA